jgi:hypothetical protein
VGNFIHGIKKRFFQRILVEVWKMSKRKKDPSKAGLGSSQVEGQGTTEHETGAISAPSSRKKQKRS